MFPEILSMLLWRDDAASTTSWHSHPHLQMGCVAAGRVDIHLPQTSWKMEPGDFYILAGGQVHKIDCAARSAEYQGFLQWTDAPQRFRPGREARNALGWFAGRSVFLKGDAEVARRIAEVEALWNSSESEAALLAECVLLHALYRARKRDPVLVECREGVTVPVQWQTREYRLFLKAIHLIAGAHHDPKLNVGDVAAGCHVSRSFLDQVFRRIVGHGPWRYVQEYRIDRARELIHQDSCTFSQIADRIGFPDIFTFSRVFKRVAGEPPSHYRKRILQANMPRET